MYKRILMPFTYVRYTGQTLSGEIGNKIGEIEKHLPTGGYVVNFGGEGYVVNEDSVVEHHFNDRTEKGPEITRRRRRDDDE